MPEKPSQVRYRREDCEVGDTILVYAFDGLRLHYDGCCFFTPTMVRFVPNDYPHGKLFGPLMSGGMGEAMDVWEAAPLFKRRSVNDMYFIRIQ